MDRRFVWHRYPLDHSDFGKAKMCPDCGPRRRQEHLNRIRATLPEAQREYTFAGLGQHKRRLNAEQQTQYDETVRACQEYAEGRAEAPWLLLAGSVGWGKTHLAVCICNYRIDHADELNLPIANFTTVPDLLARLRSGFSDETFDTEMEAYRECPMLVLDDLGAEKDTDWTHEALYRVLNHRYAARLDTVITTNADLDAVDVRIRDRLLDTHTGLVCKFALDLPSFRSGRVW